MIPTTRKSVKRGIVKCLYEASAFLSCGISPRPENQAAVLSPRTSTSLLRFYPMSKAYPNNFAAAYSNKAYALFSSRRSHLVQPKDAVEPTKQDGVVNRIPCECGEVYIGETGRPMQDTMKEHERDIRLVRTQTSAVSEHANNTGNNPLWNEVKFIDRDPHWYTRRVKEAIHIRPHPTTADRRRNNTPKQLGSKGTNHSC